MIDVSDQTSYLTAVVEEFRGDAATVSGFDLRKKLWHSCVVVCEVTKCPFTGAVNWCQQTAGSGGSQGFPASASRMASSAVMPWAAAESR